MLIHKNPGMTGEEVEQIFQRNENREVGKTLEAANDKYQSIQLAEMLGKKIEIKIKEKKPKKVEEEVKKQGKMSLVQEIYQTPGSMLTKRKNFN